MPSPFSAFPGTLAGTGTELQQSDHRAALWHGGFAQRSALQYFLILLHLTLKKVVCGYYETMFVHSRILLK